MTSLLIGDATDSRHYGVGLELGYLVTTNLWVSAGYNFFGYRDADLAGADYTARGAYVRMRYKFDESLLESAGATGERTRPRRPPDENERDASRRALAVAAWLAVAPCRPRRR